MSTKDNVLRELDSYRTAIREAFEEGYAMANVRAPVADAWKHSEAQQVDDAFARAQPRMCLFIQRRRK